MWWESLHPMGRNPPASAPGKPSPGSRHSILHATAAPGPLSWKTPAQMQMLPRVWLQSTKNAGQEKGGCYFSHLSCNSESPKPVSVAVWNAPLPQTRYICSLRTWFFLLQWKKKNIFKEATGTREQKDSASQNTACHKKCHCVNKSVFLIACIVFPLTLTFS